MAAEETVTSGLVPIYAWVVIGAVGGLIIILMGISVGLVKKGKMTIESWQENALGIPKGSVRALLALLFAFIAIGVWIATKDMPDWLIGILGAIIGFYFGSKATK